MDELLVLVVGVGERWQDEVRAIFEAVTLPHRLQPCYEDGVLALLELVGEESALFWGGIAIEEHSAYFSFLKLGVKSVAEVAKRGSDNDLVAVCEAFPNDLERGKELGRPVRPRSLGAFAQGDRVSEVLGVGAEGGEPEIVDLHPDLGAPVGWFGSRFFAADRRVCEVVFVDGELSCSWADDDRCHCFFHDFLAAVCFSTANNYGCKCFP